MTHVHTCEVLSSFHFLPDCRFLELQKPRLCKLLRVLAFAYPYTWDSLPIFYRVRTRSYISSSPVFHAQGMVS